MCHTNLKSVPAKFFSIHWSTRSFNSGLKWFFQSPVSPVYKELPIEILLSTILFYENCKNNLCEWSDLPGAWNHAVCQLQSSPIRFWQYFRISDEPSTSLAVPPTISFPKNRQHVRSLLSDSILKEETHWLNAAVINNGILFALRFSCPRKTERACWGVGVGPRLPAREE